MNQLKFIISHGTTIEELDRAPIGWSDAFIKYVRDPKLFGLLKSVTPKLRFVKGGGAELLRDIFYNEGQEAVATLDIYRRDRISLEFSATPTYTGTFDFSTFRDHKNTAERDIEITIVQTGIWETIKANMDNETEIEIDSHPDRRIAYCFNIS